jgi:hypothetical protein
MIQKRCVVEETTTKREKHYKMYIDVLDEIRWIKNIRLDHAVRIDNEIPTQKHYFFEIQFTRDGFEDIYVETIRYSLENKHILSCDYMVKRYKNGKLSDIYSGDYDIKRNVNSGLYDRNVPMIFKQIYMNFKLCSMPTI